ncbi:hypothetical protein [Kribbella sp. NPDC048928]|uniref:hypothetical protein n=1 Tax=Kribbella sp. NPDC048928 TaxID=3364111 RepID=UPI00372139A5
MLVADYRPDAVPRPAIDALRTADGIRSVAAFEAPGEIDDLAVPSIDYLRRCAAI